MLPDGGDTLYKNLADTKIKIEAIMSIAGTPKASGKQSFIPKQLTSSRRIGVTDVETNDPELTAK